ncbi:MAG: MBL fold metallo-hydrolase [Muribaculaceae bacterium]|nr:MBL fold metallo-hydrolase [Muribaculaceae bacterium]
MPRRTPVINFQGQMQIPFEEFSNDRPTPGGLPPVFGESRLDVSDNPATRVFNYISFGSGSSGNSCYIGTPQGGFIVDAGVKADIVEEMVKANYLKWDKIKGILLTHDHSDHVKYAYTLLRTHKHLRLFCTNRVLNGLLRRHGISKRIKDYHVPIFKEIPFRLAGAEITAFDVPHDGTDNMGFSINYDNRNFVIATDLGAVTERAYHYMSRATYLVIEANYDLGMLISGRYPEYLKARIRTDRGHLDNTATAAFLADVWNPGMKYIFLCHLSQDNNTPAIARRTVLEALEGKGIKVGTGDETLTDRQSDVQLVTLPRFEATRWYVFRP